MTCTDLEQGEAIELLVFGELAPAGAAAVRAHLATCASCREEHALLVAERELFAARAPALGAPPCLAAPILDAVRADARPEARVWPLVQRAVSVAAAIAASAAMFLAADRRLVTGRELDAAVGETVTSAEADGQELACALPAQARSLARTEASAPSNEELACVDGRIVCEERVASSLATP